jgi:hypothetical protein
MSRVRYPLVFILAVVLLTGSTLMAYGRIGAVVASRSSTSDELPPVDSAPETPLHSIPTRADYDRFTASDKEWREQNARQYTLAELRARGDGRRSERQALDDRVFAMMKRGNQAGAVRELERWVAKHPRDRAALLSLARLLRETGRTDASVARYRQLLSLGGE